MFKLYPPMKMKITLDQQLLEEEKKILRKEEILNVLVEPVLSFQRLHLLLR